ncbi:MAG TPA: sulfatase [Thermomicrobiales bacterium]|nr:sulfatase [Thermomicrobiales bacterium]
MANARQPNIIFIMSDDHAAHAISAYGSAINETPRIDRIANEGARFDNCFCTNSICAPSRATILSGVHSHLNGVLTLADPFDGRQETFPKRLRAAGYQTAIFGKWHLGHGGEADPTGFDRWAVLPGQGLYHDPDFFVMGERTPFQGYATDLITDFSLDWLRARDRDRPFLLMVHHKAPHRPWHPDEAHSRLYDDADIPLPETFDDDYSNRSNAARNATMRIERDLTPEDLKEPVPAGLSLREVKLWKYQRYIKDYLRCIASVDDNVGRVLDYLDDDGIADDTIVVYTSDQGFFLGDHGWYDKRFMYEESLRMPFLMRYPGEIPAGTVVDALVSNLDFAPTFLDYAGMDPVHRMQGRSFRRIAAGTGPEADWPTAVYYRYWMHLSDHGVPAHYGIRTQTHKLIYYYGEALGTTNSIDQPTPPEWELFDLASDPQELRNVYDDPAHVETVAALRDELYRLKAHYGDER